MTKPAIRTRRRVARSGLSRAQRRVFGVVVLLALGLIGTMVWAGRTTVPPLADELQTPQPAATQPMRLYYRSQTGLFDQGWLHSVGVADAATLESVASFDQARDFLLSPDGTRLYLVWPASISAHDAASGAELWRIPASDVAGADGYNPLVLSPDGATLYVLHQQPDLPWADSAYSWVQFVDTQSGSTLAERAAYNYWPTRSHLLAATDSTLFVWNGGTMQTLACINLIQRAVATTLTLGAVTGDAVLSGDGQRLYMLTGGAGFGIVIIDTATCSMLEQHDLPLLDPSMITQPGLFRLSPDGTALLLGVMYQQHSSERPPDAAVLTIAPETGEILHQTSTSSSIMNPFSLATSPLTSTFYSAGGNGRDTTSIWRFDDHADAASRIGVVEQAQISRMALGPVIDPSVTLMAPPPPSFAPTNVATSDDPTPLIWLYGGSGYVSGDVRVLALNGTVRTVGRNITVVAPRRTQPPLLVTSNRAEQKISIYDPTIATTITVDLNTQIAPHTALSPDEKTLALIVNGDPVPNDGLDGFMQLVLIDVQTGTWRALYDSDRTPLLSSSNLTGWSDGWIYGHTVLGSSSNETYRLWRVRDDGSQPEPEILIEIPDIVDSGRFGSVPFVRLNTAAGMVAYVDHWDTNADTADWRVRDLRTGDDRLLVEQVSLWEPQPVISPDGSLVAYRRQHSSSSDLLVYDRATGKTTVWASDINITSIDCTPDSQHLVISTGILSLQHDVEVAVLVFKRDGRLLNTHKLDITGVSWLSTLHLNTDGSVIFDLVTYSSAGQQHTFYYLPDVLQSSTIVHIPTDVKGQVVYTGR